MKWILLLALLAAIPIISRFLVDNKRKFHYVAFLFGYLPFGISQTKLSVSPISWPGWAGYIKGMDVTALDALAVAIIISGVRKGVKVPLKTGMIAYFLATLVSASYAVIATQPALFYSWQLLRIFTVFIAATMVCSDRKGFEYVIAGLVVGITIQTASAFQQRLSGVARPPGFFSHANQLGFMIYMIILPMFALILGNQKVKWAWWGLSMGAISVILTVSRAPLGLSLVGMALVFFISAVRHWTPHKARAGGMAAVALLIATPFALGPLQERMQSMGSSMTGEDGEREAFKRSAWMIIEDYPGGIGANNFVTVSNSRGYAAKAGVPWGSGARSQPPHQIYLLHWAEFGIIGLIGLVFMGSQMIFTCFKTAFQFRRDPRAEVMVGVGVALVMMAVHSFYEYMFLFGLTQYFIVIGLGMVAGIRHQLISQTAGVQGIPRAAPEKRASAITIMR